MIYKATVEQKQMRGKIIGALRKQGHRVQVFSLGKYYPIPDGLYEIDELDPLYDFDFWNGVPEDGVLWSVSD